MRIQGDGKTRTVYVDGRLLDPKRSQLVWNHSPDGFNWGYGGSGPAQLALAVLLVGGVDEQRAVQLHQQLKWDLIAHLTGTASFDIEFDLDEWLRRQV